MLPFSHDVYVSNVQKSKVSIGIKIVIFPPATNRLRGRRWRRRRRRRWW